MKTLLSKIKKIDVLLSVLFLCFLWAYLVDVWLPPRREARPYLALLSSGDDDLLLRAIWNLQGFEGDPLKLPRNGYYPRDPDRVYGHRLLSADAAKLVERKILQMLPEVHDPYMLRQFFSVLESPSVASPAYTGLDFGRYRKGEWDIIRDALERYRQAMHGNPYQHHFEIKKRRDVFYLERVYR